MSFMTAMVEALRDSDPVFKLGYDSTVAADVALRQLISELVGIRKASGLTQKEVARKMGISQPRVAQIEKLRDDLSAEMLIAYAAATGAEIRFVVSQRNCSQLT